MQVTGVILAGGRGSRMGGIDKGQALFHEKPLALHVLERLRPQVDEVLINANRELDAYRAFGFPVISDSIEGFAGPLAGLHSAMMKASYPLIAMVPCDAPFFPADLVNRLALALQETNADVAVVRTGAWRQPVFSLCRTALLPNLTQYMESGGRKVDTWYASLNTAEVSFDDAPEAFANINTREDLACLEP